MCCAITAVLSVRVSLRTTGDKRFRPPCQESWASPKEQHAYFHNQSYLLCVLFALATRKLKMVSEYDTGFMVGIAAHQLYHLFYLTIIPLFSLFSNLLIYLELRNRAGTNVINRYRQALDPTLNYLELPAPSPNPTQKTGGWQASTHHRNCGNSKGRWEVVESHSKERISTSGRSPWGH